MVTVEPLTKDELVAITRDAEVHGIEASLTDTRRLLATISAWRQAAFIYRKIAADGVLRLRHGYSYAKAQALYDEALAAQPDARGTDA